MHPLPHTRVPTLVFPASGPAAAFVADQIEALVRDRAAAGRPAVLGLATGSTPVGLYRELIRRHREGLDLSGVVTFNLDEYFPIPRDDPQSYVAWMHETLFRHVNIRPENIHIPDGTLRPDEVDDFCDEYERKIEAAGGIDLQVVGIGRTGHIGFNEPGSPRNSRTRMVTLDGITRRDAAAGFFGEENVPGRAITMGVASILSARRVVLLAFGEHKAGVVYKAAEQPPTEAVTASFLQDHPDSTFVLDAAAAAELTAVKRPWEVGPCDWTPALIRRAVVHLSLASKKGLQQLHDDDFRDHHLYDLLREKGPAERIGEEVFLDRMGTLTPDPASRGGSVGAGAGTSRGAGSGSPPGTGTAAGTPSRTILVFSPHPDDDVISMGGTILRLVALGHRVHVAYMTSGNIAVFDHDARRFLDFAGEFARAVGADPGTVEPVVRRAEAFLSSKRPGQPDSPDLLRVKALIRAAEARAAARACGVPADQLTFMDLRFYRTGTAAKLPVQPEDIADIVALLGRLRPAQIYVAGEMSDPHGTHRLCADAVFEAVRRTRTESAGVGVGASGKSENGSASPPGTDTGTDTFQVWLYRGAWEEWGPDEIDMAVPVSPAMLERKKQAIFRHQSQKDKAMFPGGSDRREFWQRAEDRNRNTARVYDALGLPEYYALEAFVLWRG